MYNVVINGNKHAFISKTSQSYQGENNADTLHFMIVPEFNGLSVKDECIVMWTLYTPDEEKIIDTGQINDWYEDMDKGYLQADVDININMTQIAGRLPLYVELLSTHNDLIARTNSCSIDVHPYPDSSESLSEGSLTLLNQWLLDMTDLRDEMTVSLTEIRQISDEVASIKTEVSNSLDNIEEMRKEILDKHTEVLDNSELIYGKVGSIEQALDEIIKIQEFLYGGDI